MENKNNIVLYKDLDLNEYLLLNDVDWSRKNTKFFSSLHSISYYLAMFTPSLPKYFIQKYSNENDLIMDNFSGRGTTALVSRELNRKFIGNDLNPYSFVLSKLKISQIQKTKLLSLISKLKDEYINSNYVYLNIDYTLKKNIELSYFYDDSVLKQLFFLREKYGKNWKKNNKYINAILAYALGLMHGPVKKDNSTIYFSLDMPNTISMAPNYVKKYSLKNKLIKPKVDIFEQIKKRVIDKFDLIQTKPFDAKFFLYDSTKKNKNIKDNSVSLVITSPPYLSIVNYTSSNWLKLWLLGFDRENIKNKINLSDSLKLNEYINFIKDYLIAIYDKLKIGAKVCLVVGDVFKQQLIENVWKEINHSVSYKFVEIYYDNKYTQTKKSTNMLNSKSGKATKIDKVLVLEKI